MSFLLKFIYGQLFTKLPYPTTSFSGQTIIVTGSNIGLGFEAACHFTRLDAAKVILAVRNVEKGNAAKKSIEERTGRKNNVVEVWPLDLASYDSVKAFAKRASELPRLDVLLENAGIATDKFKVFEDNESTITVNVISTYLLALLLLPKLRETSQKFHSKPRPPHLVIVSSEVHFFASFAEKAAPKGMLLATLNDESSTKMSDRYNVSKLLEVFFTRELASRSPFPNSKALQSPAGQGDVVINFVNPGLCHSELGRDAGFGLYLMKLVLARTTEAGSRTLVHASMAGEESHGQYMSNCAVAEVASTVSEDAEKGRGELQTRVWEEVMEKLEKIQPGIAANV